MDVQIAKHYLSVPAEQLLQLSGSQQPATLLRALKNSSDGDIERCARDAGSSECAYTVDKLCWLRAGRRRAPQAAATGGSANNTQPTTRTPSLHALSASRGSFRQPRTSLPPLSSLPSPTLSLALLGFARALASLADAAHSPAIAVAPLQKPHLSRVHVFRAFNIMNEYSMPVPKRAHSSDIFTRTYSSQVRNPGQDAAFRLHPTTPLTSINMTVYHGITAIDFLAYNYYSCLIFVALKHFACLVLPTKNGGASTIQIEAWPTGVLCLVLAHVDSS
ncbi:hypothetical protein BC830DRAFT_1173451 [Chytriomyces sp. MP71]|nr:hypothetical protein BC830DRAFT_1173451 [Chytriomyces sp. MP71]